MIISVGNRTDLVTYYSDWLFERFREGMAYSRNPLFPSRISQFLLTPELVDGVVFCSKNYAPVLPRLQEIYGRYRTLFHVTINGYGADLEPNSPPEQEKLATLCDLEKQVGRARIYWRYDPILCTNAYSKAWHVQTFSALAEKIAPHVAGCIVNFCELSIAIRKRIPDIHALIRAERTGLLNAFHEIAGKHKMPIRLCYNTEGATPIERKGCVTLEDIGRANGCTFPEIRHEGNRRSCLCIVSRDLGAYDSCPAGCLYCNANRTDAQVPINFAKHDVHSPLLIGNVMEGDIVLTSRQESYLPRNNRQISFFD